MKLSVLSVCSLLAFVGCPFSDSAGHGVFRTAEEFPRIGPDSDRTVDESQATWFVRPDGDDANDGKTRATAFRTMQHAVDLVQPGETVLVCTGVYKKGFWIHKEGRAEAWITIVAEPGTEIRGSDIRRDFQPVPGEEGVYQIPRPSLFPGWFQKEGVPLFSRPEQVFVDGKLLSQVGKRAMLRPENQFFVDDEKDLLLVWLENGEDPNRQATEVTMRTHAITLGLPPNMNSWREPEIAEENRTAYIRIDGFRIRHIGNFMRHAAVQVRALCHHIELVNLDVQWVNYMGMNIGGNTFRSETTGKWYHHRPHHITIRNCISSNNGVSGIGGSGLSHVTVACNILDNNNYKRSSPWNEGGACKLLDCDHTVMRWNVCRNNENHGLWYDYAHEDNAIENNLIFNSLAAGILNEVTPGPVMTYTDKKRGRPLTVEEGRTEDINGTVIRNNIVIGTRTPGGYGINNSSAVFAKVYNNILVHNRGAGLQTGGNPERGGAPNLFRNHSWANICHANFLDASTMDEGMTDRGTFFDNRIMTNLFIKAEEEQSLRLNGLAVSREEWLARGAGGGNIFHDESVFRDAARWDFRITNPELAKKIGFDPDAMRLDWSEFFGRFRDFLVKPA